MAEKKLHSFLRRLSKQRKVRIEDLANKCFLSKSTLYRYTMGPKQINPKMEAIISKALSMTTSAGRISQAYYNNSSRWLAFLFPKHTRRPNLCKRKIS